MHCRYFYFLLLQKSSYLIRTQPINSPFEYLPHDFSSFFIHNPMISVIFIFQISVRCNTRHMLSGFALGLECRFYLFADILGIHFIHNIPEYKEIVISIGTVMIIVNCNQTDSLFAEELSELTYHKIISPQSAHIFQDNGFHLSILHKLHHSLKGRSFKGCTGYTIISEVPEPSPPFFSAIIF